MNGQKDIGTPQVAIATEKDRRVVKNQANFTLFRFVKVCYRGKCSYLIIGLMRIYTRASL